MTGLRSAGFYTRLLLFVLGPLLFRYMPGHAAAMLSAMLILLITVDLALGKTLWFPARPLNLGSILLYLILTATVLSWTSLFNLPVLLCLVLFVFSFGSDIIADFTRRWILIAAGLLMMWPCRHLIIIMPQIKFLDYYWPIPLIAGCARPGIPKAADLLHTSLDYSLCRMEILSVGMKKLAAVGIKRL